MMQTASVKFKQVLFYTANISQTLLKYTNVFVIQDGGRRHLEFLKSQILTVNPLQGASRRHRAKFHRSRSNGRGDMAI